MEDDSKAPDAPAAPKAPATPKAPPKRVARVNLEPTLSERTLAEQEAGRQKLAEYAERARIRQEAADAEAAEAADKAAK